MDESSERDRGADPGPEEATDTVGLGRVVEDHRPAAEHPATDRVPGTEEDSVEEASEDSFPASDAPPFTSASGG